VTDATRKTLSYAEQNLSAAFEHAQKLVRAKDIQEAMALQTEFARSQFQAMQTQMKDLAELAQSATRSAASQATNAANQAAGAARSGTDQTSSS
jgi:phasin